MQRVFHTLPEIIPALSPLLERGTPEQAPLIKSGSHKHYANFADYLQILQPLVILFP